MADTSKKRKAAPTNADSVPKKHKKHSYWTKPGTEIQIGDAGIWITCSRGRETQCGAEVMDLFEIYGERLYPNAATAAEGGENDDDNQIDIEKAISTELDEMKATKPAGLFKLVRPELECVVFVKTRQPVDPVQLVKTICEDFAAGTAPKACRYTLRFSPATLTDKAQESNIEALARRVIAPVFHKDDVEAKTFAIQYTARNHNIMKRQDVIKTVADIVGDKHKVNLGSPDMNIVIEVFKTIITMAIVDRSYQTLKRYNIAELGSGSNHAEALDKKSSKGSRVALAGQTV